MVITLEEAKRRLSSESNPTSNLAEVRHIERRGNALGRTGHGLEFQSEVGALAHLRTAREVAEEFNISQQQVENLKQGKPDGEFCNPKLAEKIEDKLQNAKDQALEKMMLAMGLITPETLKKVDAKDAASIAASMAKVVEKTSPRRDVGSNNVLVIYAPQQKTEQKFETLEV